MSKKRTREREYETKSNKKMALNHAMNIYDIVHYDSNDEYNYEGIDIKNTFKDKENKARLFVSCGVMSFTEVYLSTEIFYHHLKKWNYTCQIFEGKEKADKLTDTITKIKFELSDNYHMIKFIITRSTREDYFKVNLTANINRIFPATSEVYRASRNFIEITTLIQRFERQMRLVKWITNNQINEVSINSLIVSYLGL